MGTPLYLKQVGLEDTIALQDDQVLPLHWRKLKDETRMLSLSLGSEWTWSGGFNVNQNGDTYIKLIRAGEDIAFVRVTVKIENKASILITFSRTDYCPFVIRNKLDTTLSFVQRGDPSLFGNPLDVVSGAVGGAVSTVTSIGKKEKEKEEENIIRHELKPQTQMDYALDEPSKPSNLEVHFETAKGTHSISMMKIGTKSLRQTITDISPFAVVEVSIVDAKKVITFRKPNKKDIENEKKEKEAENEQEEKEHLKETEIQVRLKGLEISVVDPKPSELLTITVKEVSVNLKNNAETNSTN